MPLRVRRFEGLVPRHRPLLVLLVLLISVAAPAQAQAGERARIAWDTATDIDLHAFDEAGTHSYYGDPGAIPNTTLSSDNTVGFGPESFTDDENPGTGRTFTLEVCYFEGSPDEGPTTVSGTITDGDGSSRPVSVTLGAPGLCTELGVSRGRPPKKCADGADNDADGLADGSDPGCASAEDDDEQDLADLVVETKGQDEAPEGEVIVTTTTVTNAGPAPSAGVVLDELIEGQGKVLSASINGGSCTSGEQITCEVGDLPVGGSTTLTVRTKAGEIPAEGERDSASGAMERPLEQGPGQGPRCRGGQARVPERWIRIRATTVPPVERRCLDARPASRWAASRCGRGVCASRRASGVRTAASR